MGPSHGERLATLEAVQGGLAANVAQTRLDIQSLSRKVDGQYADLKKTVLTNKVATATRAEVWGEIKRGAVWCVAQAVIIAAAVLGSTWIHIK